MRPSPGIYFRDWKQKPHFEENGEPRQNGKQGTFMFWGTGEHVNLFQGNRYPPGRASYIKDLTRQKGVCVRSWCDIQFYANKLTPKSTFIPEFWWARLNQRRLFCADKYPFLLSYLVLCMCGSRGGDRGSGRPPPPLENYKNIGFFSNTGPDPLRITMLPIQHSMLGHLLFFSFRR